MQATTFSQGFNRVEHYQIVCLERAKLNRLLDEERRFTEILIESAKREIETRPQLLQSFEVIWNKIQNHRIVRDIHQHIDCLTDAYPQFLQQVTNAHARLREKAIAILETARFAADQAIRQNRLAPSAQRLVVK